MSWTHHHNPIGISDYPHELSFEVHMHDYWTNELGTRICFFGFAKLSSGFTYRRDELHFCFEARADRASGPILERGDRTLGPICSVIINRSRKRWVNGKSVTETRKELFEGWPLQDIMNEIADFLRIYRDPQFPSPVAIEQVIFPFENGEARRIDERKGVRRIANKAFVLTYVAWPEAEK